MLEKASTNPLVFAALKKRGLLLSALAILCVALVLPFHFHQDTGKSDIVQTHCDICQFATTSHTLTSVEAISFSLHLRPVEMVWTSLSGFNDVSFSKHVSARAPPAAI